MVNAVDTYIPSFLLTINGTELRHGATVDVTSVSVTETINRADSFSVSMRERGPEPGRFAGGGRLQWLDSGILDEGNEVVIELGYVNSLVFILRGEITAITPNFPQSGLPTITVQGFSLYHRLQRKRRSKPFKDTTDQGIVQEIASEMGWSSVVDQTDVQQPVVSYDDATYASILSGRAERIAYEVSVKDRTLYYQRPGYLSNPSPSLTLEWGSSLVSFSPRISTYNMNTKVTVRASQTSEGHGKSPLVGVANAGSERVKLGPTTGTEIAKSIFGENPVRLDDHDVANQQDAEELALAQLETRSLEFITGQGSCIGSASLRARQVIELKGLGKRFSGNYYVTSTTHRIDANGYITEFEFKRNGR